MKQQKMYEASDKMISLIRDNYNLLQSLGSFGINLGFGDKTVREVCSDQNVDTYTFLAVVNFTINGYRDFDDIDKLSIPTLMQYLRASHEYYLGFQLPFIRKELQGALGEHDNLARLILKLYDEYAHSIRSHMQYEEKMVFPYVNNLLEGKTTNGYDIETFSKHHGKTDDKLRELKSIIIKYYPNDQNAALLSDVLMDIYMVEEDFLNHCHLEDTLFAQSVRLLECLPPIPSQEEEEAGTETITPSLGGGQGEVLSEREREVIRLVAMGLSNKEIAERMFIAVNTVMTHRRNISRKLDIHSAAGLTIYAIVNGIINVEEVAL